MGPLGPARRARADAVPHSHTVAHAGPGHERGDAGQSLVWTQREKREARYRLKAELGVGPLGPGSALAGGDGAYPPTGALAGPGRERVRGPSRSVLRGGLGRGELAGDVAAVLELLRLGAEFRRQGAQPAGQGEIEGRARQAEQSFRLPQQRSSRSWPRSPLVAEGIGASSTEHKAAGGRRRSARDFLKFLSFHRDGVGMGWHGAPSNGLTTAVGAVAPLVPPSPGLDPGVRVLGKRILANEMIARNSACPSSALLRAASRVARLAV